ncbi:MAG: hypothetical protein IJZ83_00805 [Clostridia bacterium]|nr:hypothetical protein [Clostridia bacterium]
MSKKERTNIAESYLTQKAVTKLDIVSIVIIAVGVLIYIFGYGIGYLGIPLTLIGVVIKIFSTSAKVKDSDYDEILDRIINANYIDLKKPHTLMAYDLSSAPVTVGKDKKARSGIYCISSFNFGEGECTLDICTVDICTKQIDRKSFKFSLPVSCELVEEACALPERKAMRLKISSSDIPPIPVNNASYDLDVIMRELQR